MDIKGCRALITGGASGLGAALAHELRDRGCSELVLLDRDAMLTEVADSLGARLLVTDLTDANALKRDLQGLASWEPDVVVANAGTISRTDLNTPDAEWDQAWQLHVMSNVRLFRHFLPAMRRRGRGHLASTASTVAISPTPKSLVYSVTKHAQLALAEWLAASTQGSGVGFTCFCPGSMATPMLIGMQGGRSSAGLPEEPASARESAVIFVDAIEAGEFLVMPQVRTQRALRLRGSDHSAWLQEVSAFFAAHGADGSTP